MMALIYLDLKIDSTLFFFAPNFRYRDLANF